MRFLSAARSLFLIPVLLAGCNSSQPKTKVREDTTSSKAATVFPARPGAAPPTFKLFHQDNDTLTLVTTVTATDDEVSAILWQLREATQQHTFDALHLPQKFVDARQPTIWFHVYRGARCAGEKYTKGALPCEASYHGAGDYTLGSYSNPHWNDGVLRHQDGTETRLWNPDLP